MLSEQSQLLADYMSELSRQAFQNNWVQHLEFMLWHAIVQGPMHYGDIYITEAHIKRLRFLRDQCRGWVYYHRTEGLIWVQLPAWQDIYTSNYDPVTL